MFANWSNLLSTLVKRGGAPSPLPLPTPSSLATSPPLPPALPSCRVKYVLGHVMGGNGSAPGGCWQRNTTCLTATPSAAGRLPPPLRSVSSRLLDLYHECVVNGIRARALCDARGRTEKFIFIRKTEPMPALTVLVPPCKHGHPASDRRRARDKRRREGWAERKRNRSQPRLHTHPAEDDFISRPACAGIDITCTVTSTASQAPVASPPQPASLLPAALALVSPSPVTLAPTVSPQPAPPPRKHARTYSEATRASSRAAVLAKKGKFRNSTAALHHLCRHRRRGILLSSPLLKHPCSQLHHQYPWRWRHPLRRGLYRRGGIFATTAIEENAIATSVWSGHTRACYPSRRTRRFLYIALT